MANVKAIRALARGLEVLERLDECSGATLHELHQMTGMSKATLLRILQTLMAHRWVHCTLGEGIYHLGEGAREVGRSPRRESLIAELATPILEQLCRKAAWPSDVALFNGMTMEIVETTRKQAPIIINRKVIRLRPHMLWSALGRAYLAFCPPAECDEILSALRRSPHQENRAARDRARVQSLLDETRAQGYGVRERGYWIKGTELYPDIGAIAVPVTRGERVVACVNMLWIAETMTVEAFAAKHLESLKEAAGELAACIEQKKL